MSTESRDKTVRRQRKRSAIPKEGDTTSQRASSGTGPIVKTPGSAAALAGALKSESRALSRQTRTKARPATRADSARVIRNETAPAAEAIPPTAPRGPSSRTGSRPQAIAKKQARTSLPPPSRLQEEISVRAYHLFLERMRSGAPGDEGSDWRKAEIEIKARYGL